MRRLELRRRLPQGGFAARVGFNGVAQVAPVVVTLALTPLLLDRLGVDRFGVWSLALIALGTLTSLDGGVSASLARFFAVHAARDDRADAGRLLVGALVFFLGFGLVVTAAAFGLAPTLVGLLHIPASLEQEATSAFRWLPLIATVALAANAAGALLQGSGQFREYAIATVTSVGAFAVGVVVFVQPDAQVTAAFAALALRYGVMVVVGLVLASRRIAVSRPLFPSWSSVREVGHYSSRMQLAALSGFVNAELDGFVIAAVAPVRYVGLYSIGLQAASAARSIPLYAFSPMLTRLTTTFRQDGRAATASEFGFLERRWLPTVLGYGVLALGAIGFSVTVWLGDDYVLSGVTAVILLLGYVVHVGLTGARTCYVRAVGRPGLEARYSTVWTICNAALTVPLGIAAGMIGVVSATAATGILASVYFVFLCRRAERLPVVIPERRWWILAAGGGCVTVAGELVVVRTGLNGFVGLAATALPPLLALAIFAPIERRWFKPGEPRLGRVTSA
jgi:O-antigen/teichoic acid export membrane protein